MSRAVNCGFVPLVDAAPLVIAAEIGFAAEEGLSLALHREVSWATLRDKLIWGGYDAAHMLAPVIVAQSGGVGVGDEPLDALMMLSVNGQVIGVGPDLAAGMRARAPGFLDARATGAALLAASEGRRLRVGVPFPFSTHALLMARWFEGLGAGRVELATVPPPRMARAMAAGEVDAFCVGEPWGSVAVEQGTAELILPGAAIWQFAPEKALAMPRAAVEAEPEIAAALMRAVWRAARWLGDPANLMTAAELLGRPACLDLSPEIIERALRGRLVIDRDGAEAPVPRLVEFFDAAATFPWRSQGLLIADWLARLTGADRARLRAAARAAFRTDLYRAVLGPIGADLPGASEKLEGAMAVPTAVASTLGGLVLGPDRFFDGTVFDPSDA
ncbi:CmpA/NrtA family ABC transporter substrate-binding protein [Amaricoccus solimangrovi]|uniref:ABC transporter substrate-binding protein n=1 Tax=Amaricoccus solimangrovi TaxID=2589815 RepID=A0A501WZ72_9RHOB|nr:CmpA/NrtA family ABC transporter substrate-binding protein [Amaricoccus solimangrovi]TPE53625.1 ABC transporter substrate-binding protein [Amaricoccus solimangrovi]